MSDKLTVLLSEDEKEVAQLYRLKLTLDGYSVEVAEDGESGLKKALEIKPELIFLDIKMPGMDGFEVLKHLRESEVTKKTPIVILSNFDEQEMIEKGLTLGANEDLIKSQFNPAGHTTKTQNNSTILVATLNQKIVGKGKSVNFKIFYTIDSLAVKRGRIWEVNIPQIVTSENVSAYKLTGSVPKNFGKLGKIAPQPSQVVDETTRTNYIFSQDSLVDSGID